MKTSVLAFVAVGALAALVHYVAAVSSHLAGISAWHANNIGFLVAFPVSYIGHRHWSFQGTQASHAQAFLRFFLVALSGFIGNQVLLWAALRWTPAPFWLALGAVMVIVAVSTFLLSRFWAFSHG